MLLFHLFVFLQYRESFFGHWTHVHKHHSLGFRDPGLLTCEWTFLDSFIIHLMKVIIIFFFPKFFIPLLLLFFCILFVSGTFLFFDAEKFEEFIIEVACNDDVGYDYKVQVHYIENEVRKGFANEIVFSGQRPIQIMDNPVIGLQIVESLIFPGKNHNLFYWVQKILVGKMRYPCVLPLAAHLLFEKVVHELLTLFRFISILQFFSLEITIQNYSNY